jgi:hypothetical protein
MSHGRNSLHLLPNENYAWGLSNVLPSFIPGGKGGGGGGEFEMLNSQHAKVQGAIYKHLCLLKCTDSTSASSQSWLTNINLIKWTTNSNKKQ